MATDTKSPGEKLSVTSKTTLTLKPRAETGVITLQAIGLVWMSNLSRSRF